MRAQTAMVFMSVIVPDFYSPGSDMEWCSCR